MKVIATLFIVGFFSHQLCAQEVVVVVRMKDKTHGDAIQNVNSTISIGAQTFYQTTNSKGIFTFETLKSNTISFKFSHPQFISSSEAVQLNRLSAKNDSLFLDFEMEFMKTQDIEEMVVAAPGTPVTVYESTRMHVADFEIINNGDLVLLTYSKQLKKGSELMLYDGLEVINTFQVPGTAEELVRDYRGNPHVVCAENVFGIHVSTGRIGISTLSKDYFIKYLAPVVDTNKTKLYFSTFNPDYPAFEYFSYDQQDSTYLKIMGVEDELMMELYRAEYKWVDVRTKLWAKNQELATGIDAEIWVGANVFTQSIYYKELYAPLFHRNDTLFVFDYYKDKLFKYNFLGEPIDSVGIYHHYNPKTSGWRKKLIQDRKTGEIYALFQRAGYSYLGRVDTRTGEITEQVKLEYRYIDKIEIFDNFVYYVYRPFESIQKRYLYKERLPYEFGSASVPDGDEVKTKE